MKDFSARVVAKKIFAPGLFSLTCRAPELASQTEAGQFAMVGVAGRSQPYLRRAFSVADRDLKRGEVEFLIKTVGPGTACLEGLPEGSNVELLGPLGNGFSIDGLSSADRVAIVAGGVGVAPFPILLRALAAKKLIADLYFGGRTAADLSYRARISPLVTGEEFDATDDGSAATRGHVTEVLLRKLHAGASYKRLYGCGPTPMFKTLAKIVAEFSIPAEFSTEAPMGCGFGVCLGCVLPSAEGGFLVSCREGPILPPARINWSLC